MEEGSFWQTNSFLRSSAFLDPHSIASSRRCGASVPLVSSSSVGAAGSGGVKAPRENPHESFVCFTLAISRILIAPKNRKRRHEMTVFTRCHDTGEALLLRWSTATVNPDGRKPILFSLKMVVRTVRTGIPVL